MFAYDKLSFSNQSLLKALAHVSKYPNQEVFGCFSGKEEKVLDCFPLFHQNLTVNPTLAIALNLVEKLVKQVFFF